MTNLRKFDSVIICHLHVERQTKRMKQVMRFCKFSLRSAKKTFGVAVYLLERSAAVLVAFLWASQYLAIHRDAQLISSWQHFHIVVITVHSHSLQSK